MAGGQTLAPARACNSQVYLVQLLQIGTDLQVAAYFMAELEGEVQAQMEGTEDQATMMGRSWKLR